MRRIGFFQFLCGVFTSTIIATSQSFAIPITFTEQATATGSLGGIPFTDDSITLTLNTDTANITEPQPGFFIVPSNTATLSVGTLQTATILDLAGVFSNTITEGVGFEDSNGDILDDGSAVFKTYDLSTSIGPITGESRISGKGDSTTAGTFLLSSAGDATFTATTGSAVPEPSTWAMMLLGFVGLGFAGYLRTRRGAAVTD